MDENFWLQRWRENQIGFHQSEINSHLQHYWPRLELAGPGRVFVPLCGKSRDMSWLAGQGHAVLGVELARMAVEDFYRAEGVQPEIEAFAGGERFIGAGVELICGDFFSQTTTELGSIDAVFDRAALVALPPDMRKRYAAHMTQLTAPGTPMLLVTLDYPQQQMGGPPFAVSEEEVFALYRQNFTIEVLDRVDVLEQSPPFQAKGLQRLHENVFLLRRR